MNELIGYNYSNIMNIEQKHFISRFLESKRSDCTRIAYDKDIKDFFGVSNVKHITIDIIRKVNLIHVTSYINKLESEGLSSATVNRKVSSLSGLYNWLMKFRDNENNLEIIKYNPFSNISEEKPVINNKETEFLTESEVLQLMRSIDISSKVGLRNKTLLGLAFTTAIRKSEIINIKIKDISNVNGYDVIHVIRKGGKQDTVKLQEPVKALIMEYIQATNRSIPENEKDYLFKGHSTSGINNDRLDPSTLNYMIKAISKKAGINKKLCVHSTRHTAITLAIVKGASIEKVRDFASHANLSTTNRYIHSIDKLKDNAGDLLKII
ncbi:MAG TPA: integrase [Clostridiales bacterium]|nr:MAG: integrase [Clostridiales bacterium GWD2_32_19]HCC07264.1 integrase [Clostridiales bacterium]